MNKDGLNLTEEQEALIALNEGAFLVIAPPGSGKTTVLTERVARLVSDQAETFRVLALTFTNKAASNMRSRLFSSVGQHSRRVTATTIHAFALEALRAYGEVVDIPSNASIYENEDDRIAALHQGLVDEGILRDGSPANNNLKSILSSISGLKRSLVPPEEAPGTIEEGEIPLDVAYVAYNRVMRSLGALDFDDILFYGLRIFSEQERIAQQYRRTYRYIVIDEAQDTNVAQYELLKALCGATHRNVMLVADADQSIFRFAGATTKNLLRFEEDFGARRLGLSRNFRCASNIVAAANRLISNNPARITTGSAMTSAVLAAGHVEAASYEDEHKEATGVIQILLGLLQNGLSTTWCHAGEAVELAAEDICILGRSKFVLPEVMAALQQANIAHQFSAGRDSLFETTLFTRFECALRLVHNPADRMARRVFRVAGSGDRSLGALMTGVPPWQASILESIPHLADDPRGLGNVVDTVVQRTSRADIPDEHERAATLAEAKLLERRWGAFRAHHGSDATIARFLGDIALAGRAGIDGPGVRVLTIHAAKGLEFRAVIVVGMNEGSFPDYRSKSEEEVADERRNAYVALTRGERVVYMTRPRSRLMPWGDAKRQHASRFLGEAGIAVIDR